MKVALDCNALITWSAARDPDDVARLEALFADGAVVVPMPAYAEFLTGARDDDRAWVDALTRKPRFKLAPFDRRSANECAQLHKRLQLAASGGGKRGAGRTEAWQKIKFDRQILSIALAEGCELLVCADDALKREAVAVGLKACAVGELPLPPSAAQRKLDLAIVGPPNVSAVPTTLPQPTPLDQ